MPDAPQALRLTFSYKGSEITLIDSQEITKAIPPTDAIETDYPLSGFSFELKDAGDASVFRRFMHSPIPDSVEVFPSEGRGPITQQTVRDPEGVFTVLVPVIREARALVFHDSPVEAGLRRRAAQELVRFDVGDLMERASREDAR